LEKKGSLFSSVHVASRRARRPRKEGIDAEYAHRHLDEYTYVFWASADSWEALASGYAAIAGLLKLPGADAQDQTLAVQPVKRWLASRAECAVRAVDRAFPKVEFSTWALCDRLLAQALTCVGLINQWGFEFPEGARLLNHTGSYLHERGRYTEAEPLFERALGMREKALDPEHPEVAASLNDLAGLYRAQGQYAKAEPLYQRALAIREKALGPNNPDVAEGLNDLAVLYYNQGRYAQAEPLYERSLVILKKALGPEHLNVATSLNNLAGLYDNQCQYAKAEPLCERSLAILENSLGPEHPNVATSLENYALCLRGIDRSQEAELLESRAKAIRAKTA
jgi:tetratricopeptide (TPR) repeat protein